jgi:phosphatidylinositol alpha 1,6-mannosyltransferase
MRIAVVTESFLPTVNGVARSVAHVADQLAARGHEVLIVAPGPGPDRHGRIPVRRMPSIPLPWATDLPLGLPTERLRSTLLRFDADVLYLASPILLGARAAAVARELEVPTVAIYQTDVAGFAAQHGLSVTQSTLWRWLRRVHNGCDRTLAPSRAAVADLRLHGIGDVHRWGRGVDPIAFSPTHRARASRTGDARLRIGYVGRLSAEKRVDRLHLLSDLPGTEVVVVGDGDARERLERILPTARFTGMLRGRELSRAYADLDVFVHTGTDETFGQTIQEAQASGVAVVAPAAGGPLDLVRHGRNGLLWDPLDDASLRTCVARLVEDHELRDRLGRAGRHDVRSRTWAALTDQLVPHLRHVATRVTHSARDAA